MRRFEAWSSASTPRRSSISICKVRYRRAFSNAIADRSTSSDDAGTVGAVARPKADRTDDATARSQQRQDDERRRRAPPRAVRGGSMTRASAAISAGWSCSAPRRRTRATPSAETSPSGTTSKPPAGSHRPASPRSRSAAPASRAAAFPHLGVERRAEHPAGMREGSASGACSPRRPGAPLRRRPARPARRRGRRRRRCVRCRSTKTFTLERSTSGLTGERM